MPDSPLTFNWLGTRYDVLIDVNDWLGPELTAVEKHYGNVVVTELNARQLTYGAVYVTLKRRLPTISWEALEGMTFGEFQALLGADEEQLPVDPTAGGDQPTSSA